MLLVIWEPIGRKNQKRGEKKIKRENTYGIFVCNGLSFIGMVLGDGHKGRGDRGRGVFWKTKAGSHSWQKKHRAGEARVFIRLSWWKFTIALFSFHLPLPTSHCIIPPPSLLSFLIPLSHEAPLPPRASPWPVTARDLQEHRYKHTLPNPTSQPHFSSCVSPSSLFKSFFSPCSCLRPGRQLFNHLLHLLSVFSSSLASFLSTKLCLTPHALFSSLQCPRPDIKGSMKEYVPSIPYTPARTHPDTYTRTHMWSQTHKSGPGADKQGHARTLRSFISAGSCFCGRLVASALTHRCTHSWLSLNRVKG